MAYFARKVASMNKPLVFTLSVIASSLWALGLFFLHIVFTSLNDWRIMFPALMAFMSWFSAYSVSYALKTELGMGDA